MDNLSRALPPLNALRTFEAAARLGSFKAAAEEICVTQAAISRQIQTLESYYELPLFKRSNRKVELTAEGRLLYLTATQALQQIATCSQELKRRNVHEHLTLATTTSFSRLWLLPRLKQFHQAYPGIQLHLISGEGSPALHDSFDAAVTLGFEQHPDYVADFLFSEEIFPVCTPGFLISHPKIAALNGLLEVALLNLSADHWKARLWPAVDWDCWLQHFGLNLANRQPALTFSHFPLVIDAVQEEIGVGLAWRHLVDKQLADGSLVRPVKESWHAHDRCHYFVCRRDIKDSEQISILRNWLLAETGPLRDHID